jgi:cold shock CspA family protein
MNGTVARIVPDGQFGFIEGEDRQEYFFHATGLKGTEFGELAPGTPVQFSLGADEKGDAPNEHQRAVNVHLADGATPAVDNEVLPAGKTR